VTLGSRYLPDGRDLNRSFPGSPRGSLAAQLAHLFFERIARRCDVGLDFHTGSGGRCNLPHLRCDLDDGEARRLADAFAPPLQLHASVRDGSLRAAARKRDIPVLIYEAGEAMRFCEQGIQLGVNGALRVLRALGMIAHAPSPPADPPLVARSSRWCRANRSGFCRIEIELGQTVATGQQVATIVGATGRSPKTVRARRSGLVLGLLRTGLVHRGDALVHIADLAG
jgi:predicted deacylase